MRRFIGVLATVAAAVLGISAADAGHVVVDLTEEGELTTLEVAPNGNVYVASRSEVFVFDPTGDPLGSVVAGGVFDMAWLDGSMWLAATFDSQIVELDGTTHATGVTWAAPAMAQSIAAGDGVLYLSTGGDISSLDPGTGTLTDLEVPGSPGYLFATSPGRPGELFVARSGSSSSISRLDVDSVPATLIDVTASGAIGGALNDYEVDEAGSLIHVAAWDSPDYPFHVLDVATMDPAGSYPGSASPNGVASAGGRFVGTVSAPLTENVWLWEEGTSEPLKAWRLDAPLAHGVGLSPDGETVYVLTDLSVNRAILNVLTLEPAPPQIQHVAVDNGTFEVWFAPSSPGDAITTYSVTGSPGGWSCTTTTTSCVVEPPGPVVVGTEHTLTFTVVAENEFGQSEPSAPAGPYTSAREDLAVPFAPVVIQPAPTLTWSEHSIYDGGEVEVVFREFEIAGDWLAPLIVGGSDIAYDPNRHVVKLVAFDGSTPLYECDGVVIADEWVLTAAHCLEYDDGLQPEYIAVVYGHAYWPDALDDIETYRRFSQELWTHPDYTDGGVADDIGLIRLDLPVDRRYVDPIPLSPLIEPVDGASAFVAGWGLTATGGDITDDLQGLEVVVDRYCGDWAEAIGPFFDPAGMVCTDTSPAGVCDGDSGGPLVGNHAGVLVLLGIVSFRSAVGCGADPDLPDVYMTVAHYAEWIEGHTGALWMSATVQPDGVSAKFEARTGRSYLVAATSVGQWTSATEFVTVTTPGVRLLSLQQIGVDCTNSLPHPFIDVPASSFAHDSVGCIYQLDVTTGTSSTTYSPTQFVTRAQMGAFLGRFYERVTGEPCVGAHPFADIDPSSWADAPIGCIYGLGITKGTSASTFSPDDFVTREQMGAFIARMYRTIVGQDCGFFHHFTDVPLTSYAYLDIGCILSLGITTGTSSSTYSPAALVTREQMAAFLERMYGQLPL